MLACACAAGPDQPATPATAPDRLGCPGSCETGLSVNAGTGTVARPKTHVETVRIQQSEPSSIVMRTTDPFAITAAAPATAPQFTVEVASSWRQKGNGACQGMTDSSSASIPRHGGGHRPGPGRARNTSRFTRIWMQQQTQRLAPFGLAVSPESNGPGECRDRSVQPENGRFFQVTRSWLHGLGAAVAIGTGSGTPQGLDDVQLHQYGFCPSMHGCWLPAFSSWGLVTSTGC